MLSNKSRKPCGRSRRAASYVVVAPPTLLSTWKGAASQSLGCGHLDRPPALQQGWIFRFIGAAAELLEKTTAPLSLRKRRCPISIHLPFTSSLHLVSSGALSSFPSISPAPFVLRFILSWGKSRLKEDSETQVRVLAECLPFSDDDKAPSHLKGRGDLEIRHFIASQGQLCLRVGLRPLAMGPSVGSGG